MEQIVEKIHGFTDAKEIYDAVGFRNGDLIIKEWSLFPDTAGINTKTNTITFEPGSGVNISSYTVLSVMQESSGGWVTPYEVMTSGSKNVLVPSVRLYDYDDTNGGISITYYSKYATGSVKVRVVLLRIMDGGYIRG